MNGMMKKMIVLVFLMLTLNFRVENAEAQVFEFLPAWTHTANACAIDRFSLNFYEIGHHDLRFKKDVISPVGGQVSARCNVLNPLDQGNPNWNTLILGYQDPDGAGTNTSVCALLARIERPTNDIKGPIAQVCSDSINDPSKREIVVNFSYNWDFLNNEYFIYLYLTRKTKSGNGPIAFMVRLTETRSSD